METSSSPQPGGGGEAAEKSSLDLSSGPGPLSESGVDAGDVPTPREDDFVLDGTAETPAKVIVHILKASGIAGFTTKKGKSTSDCFAVLTVTSQPTLKFTTKTIKKTTDPVWNQYFVVDFTSADDSIKIELFHYLYFGENKSLGFVNTSLNIHTIINNTL